MRLIYRDRTRPDGAHEVPDTWPLPPRLTLDDRSPEGGCRTRTFVLHHEMAWTADDREELRWLHIAADEPALYYVEETPCP